MKDILIILKSVTMYFYVTVILFTFDVSSLVAFQHVLVKKI